jgi:hypothetical protein
VNADESLSSVDALVCATFGMNPDNPNLPARVGKPIGSVLKESHRVHSNAGNVPILRINTQREDERTSIHIGFDTDVPHIGSAIVLISWDTERFTYQGIGEAQTGTVVNHTSSDTGELYIGNINVEESPAFEFPQLYFKHVTNSGIIAVRIIDVGFSDTYASLSGDEDHHVTSVETESVPSVCILRQNFPNPFNPTTTIPYALPKSAHISLIIYNTRGQQIKTLVNSYQQPGHYAPVWNGTDNNGIPVGSGLYFYKMDTPDYSEYKRMILVR